MIVTLFGQPACGKTTLSKMIVDHFKAEGDVVKIAVIDGDILRDLTKNYDYSYEGRVLNFDNATAIANYLVNLKMVHLVVIAMVLPYKIGRDNMAKKFAKSLWFYLSTDQVRGREKFFVQDFDVPDMTDAKFIDTSKSHEECLEIILKRIYTHL
jgi:adenylylsulfate kinase-like enzyme